MNDDGKPYCRPTRRGEAMSSRPKCPTDCGCICHDWPGHPAMHLPGMKGCPGKHGYVMNDRDEWIKEKR